MRIPQGLFLPLLFLGLFDGLFSTNPDSVMVQGPEDNDKRSEKIQENQQKLPSSAEIPRGLVVMVLRPVVIDSQVYLKEVNKETLQKLLANRFPNGFRKIAISQQSFRRTTGKTVADVNSKTTVVNGMSHISPFSFKANSGTNLGNDRLSIPQTNFKGNGGTNGDYDRRPMLQDNFKGNSGTNVANIRPPMPQTNFKGNNGDDKSLTPPNNFKGNNNNNGGNSNAFSSSPFDITEDEEAFFEDDDPEHSVTKSPERIPPQSIVPQKTSPLKMSSDSNLFAGVVNDFAFKLVENLNMESNFVLSPLSIYIPLAMCYLGADGRTKDQMEQTLGMNDYAVRENRLHRGIGELLKLVKKKTTGYELFVANGMFLGKNFVPDAQFEKDVENYYQAQIQKLDFGNPELSLQYLNKWVSDVTQNMIPSIVNSPPPPLTRLILLNAIFFKGIWKTQFPVHLTYTGTFHLLDGRDKEVQFMNLFDTTFPIVRSDKHRNTFIKLPYEGDQVSMIIALPFTAREKPLASIRDEILCQIRDEMVNTKLDTVAIPKFRMEHRISLRNPLQDLGLTDIFNRNAVDLRKLRKENDVYVSAIMHKSVIEIDEVGTTASASTEVGYVPLIYRNISKFVADHPFAFYIIHEPTGVVLFHGKKFDFESVTVVPNVRNSNLRGRPRPSSDRRMPSRGN